MSFMSVGNLESDGTDVLPQIPSNVTDIARGLAKRKMAFAMQSRGIDPRSISMRKVQPQHTSEQQKQMTDAQQQTLSNFTGGRVVSGQSNNSTAPAANFEINPEIETEHSSLPQSANPVDIPDRPYSFNMEDDVVQEPNNRIEKEIEQTDTDIEVQRQFNIQKKNAEHVKDQYFKDAIGNEYRMKSGKLYVKGWSDASMKVRLISKNGKELPLDGKKVQLYGWHLVNAVKEDEIEKTSESEELDSIGE